MAEIILHPQPNAITVEERGNKFHIPLRDLRSSNWEEMRESLHATLVVNGNSLTEEQLNDERVKNAILRAVRFDEPLRIEVVKDDE